MTEKINIAVVGMGRIGTYHALHAAELSKEGLCSLAALVDPDSEQAEKAKLFLHGKGYDVPDIAYAETVEELVRQGTANGAVICSPNHTHYANARHLIDNGYKVLCEKPLTADLEEARDFATYLTSSPEKKASFMLALQRRFDEAITYAKRLIEEGVIGEPFRIVSILEDPEPQPVNYMSTDNIVDMTPHNIDEIMYLFGGIAPVAVSAQGFNVHNYKVTADRAPGDREQFDDSSLQLWFDNDRIGKIQISRNYLAGYKNHTEICGTKGVISIDPFEGLSNKVYVDVHTINGLDYRTSFTRRNYGPDTPCCVERFGNAYKEELRHFLENFHSPEPFGINHVEGLNTMIVAYGASAVSIDKGTPVSGFLMHGE
ncbi:Gfo/Idh/MocA family protein [candidate division KSB1 bacterium]